MYSVSAGYYGDADTDLVQKMRGRVLLEHDWRQNRLAVLCSMTRPVFKAVPPIRTRS